MNPSEREIYQLFLDEARLIRYEPKRFGMTGGEISPDVIMAAFAGAQTILAAASLWLVARKGGSKTEAEARQLAESGRTQDLLEYTCELIAQLPKAERAGAVREAFAKARG